MTTTVFRQPYMTQRSPLFTLISYCVIVFSFALIFANGWLTACDGFMVLLLVGWVIWNNKPLPLPMSGMKPCSLVVFYNYSAFHQLLALNATLLLSVELMSCCATGINVCLDLRCCAFPLDRQASAACSRCLGSVAQHDRQCGSFAMKLNRLVWQNGLSVQNQVS